MKRLGMLFTLLLLAAPVMAKDGLTRKQEKELAKFKKEATAQIEKLYTEPVGSAVFEITCTGADGYYGSEEFTTDVSSESVNDLVIPVSFLKRVQESNGFCILGPIDLQARKQVVLQMLDDRIALIRGFYKLMNESKHKKKVDNEQLHTDGVVHVNP